MNTTDFDEGSVHFYTTVERRGMIAQTVASGISLTMVLGLIFAMMISICVSRRSQFSSTSGQFMRRNVGVYFLCLLLCDFSQSIGSIISLDWILDGYVHAGTACSAQAIFFQFGNVGSALWSLAIATHTFALLFLRFPVSGMACLVTFVGVWVITAGIVAIGPAVIQNDTQGPFHGLSGTWCWITEEYTGSRLGLEYFWLFFSAFFSFVLYTLVFLRLRGNILVANGSIQFRFVERDHAWTGSAERETVESQVLNVARQMLWYPVAYSFLILPIAICRWTNFSGGNVSEAATVAANCIFLLSGAVNVVLFTTTRRVIPKRSSLPLSVPHSKIIKNGNVSTTNWPPGLDASAFAAYANEPETPTTEDGEEMTPTKSSGFTYSNHRPNHSRSSSDTLTIPSPSFQPLNPNSPGGARYYFAPSSPELQSIQESPVSLRLQLGTPVHLRQIPMVITTPPSPSPSQRTHTTTTTDTGREREVMEARSTLPMLTRF
ncbi:hypothetical protein FRB96_008869 [Tulasnella sp. 330]|nr:hypothetical protein FRB96_008869 [Tulasnella sp. 330]KAG8880592.1 hypothetical protein FRB97_000687 [Tulasnella sp. 331]KAG8884492.1 hypothetical protein FRB98_002355 [Tulasnella sp. 332]